MKNGDWNPRARLQIAKNAKSQARDVEERTARASFLQVESESRSKQASRCSTICHLQVS